MANNRLYIVDTETGDKFLLCKSFGQWTMHPSSDEFDNWLKDRDIASTTGTEPTKLVLKTENEL
jgi:hypothetical protein